MLKNVLILNADLFRLGRITSTPDIFLTRLNIPQVANFAPEKRFFFLFDQMWVIFRNKQFKWHDVAIPTFELLKRPHRGFAKVSSFDFI